MYTCVCVWFYLNFIRLEIQFRWKNCFRFTFW
jgi:hypothetical protein